MTTLAPEAFSLNGHHVLITGGGRGLGKAIAAAVSGAGAHVTLVARGTEQLVSAAHELRKDGASVDTISADIGDLAVLDDLIAHAWTRFGPLTGVVHAAGIQLRKPAVEVGVEEFLRVQNVNLHAPYFLSTAIARRQLDNQSSGSHVFIGSLNSSIGLPRISPYVVSKTGLVGVARAFSTEWASQGIRSNVIAPGYFSTEMTEQLLASPADRDRILGRIPAGELGQGADVGNACVYFLSDASRYTTGTLHNVDGGWLSA
jgi:2-deoxy-D-gluconate 3-dehydrogenase